ncbi:patatin-like phospholipase family protein [Saccharopolyspora shandongensis]|uniref:patatin-like phospholipase family protein n=1 Tax=Saccharopolyspora shandongensis TaxID=418495 RepID=UPI0033ECEC0C
MSTPSQPQPGRQHPTAGSAGESTRKPAASGERIALVLAGGGARGAYEAGVMSVLLPELDRLGLRPSLFVGTSVGAMNAAYFAATQHQTAEQAISGLLECWREVGRTGITRPMYVQLPIAAAQYLGQVLSLPGFQFSSLLDPTPLERGIQRWIDLSRTHRNIADGAVDALAVMATAVRSGRTVAFVERSQHQALHRSHVLDYMPAWIQHAHLRASAALPVLFPPVRIETPPEAHGWYVDGGTRLNTPIKPALDLGADRIVVIGTDAVTAASDEPGRHEGKPPDLVDGALHLLEGALVDPLAEDIVTLGNVNMFYTQRAPATTRYRRARGKPPYRRVPYIFVAPNRRGAIGEHALEVFRSRRRSISLHSLQQRLLSQLLGGESPAHGQLLSYLFFDAEFLDELIAMGQRDAQHWLTETRTNGDHWQIGPLPTLTNH